MESRKKILFISDHPLIPSGVGSQAKYLIEGLLETNKYKFVCFGGAIKHPNYTPQQVAPEKFGEGNWIIYPVDGHGSKELLRQTLYFERPDAVVIFTDPRFFYWVWEIEDEIRQICPLLYWHVWDNDPLPKFNKIFYDSTDHIVALSLKTFGLLQGLGYDESKFSYIPHSLPDQLFKPLSEEENAKFKKQYYGPHADKKFIVMWNNRNARRKMTGDVVEAFADFAHKVGKDKVALFMHTAAKDPEGQDVLAAAENFGIDDNIILSEDRIEPAVLNHFYNVADVTISISSNEGFGLGTLESLFAGTPIIVHMTGGLQYQVGDWWDGFKNFDSQKKLTEQAKKKWSSRSCNWWGAPVFPATRNCVGSQQVPYIYDDRTNKDEVVKALCLMYDLGREERRKIGLAARQWAVKNFNHEDMISSWDKTLEKQVRLFNEKGSKKEVRIVSL